MLIVSDRNCWDYCTWPWAIPPNPWPYNIYINKHLNCFINR